jgi:hypothetical protein
MRGNERSGGACSGGAGGHHRSRRVRGDRGTAVTTWLTLRHQRKAEDKRRQHERHMRLLERSR